MAGLEALERLTMPSRQSSFASDTEAEMSDERRAEVEAVVTAISGALLDQACKPISVGPIAEAAIAALDRLRDARGDDEAGRCPTCGLHYDEDSAGAECSRLEADLVDIHDALADPDESSPINADWIIERIEALKAAARSPQGEDHEVDHAQALAEDAAGIHTPGESEDER